ncbi:MAG: hypothetical protein A2Y14_05385 [Verrucomicrobia bacterium GWF2_51_19]|nr:MAG: hypothetical protein A2Y14_05385 [Verrucomicrobia bacterium GWF2_51_19]HCJ12442.1 hypothetical protein [Opitutae bacterium]
MPFIRQHLWFLSALGLTLFLFFYWQSLEDSLLNRGQKFAELELAYKNILKNKERSVRLDEDFRQLEAIDQSINSRLLHTTNRTQSYGFFLKAEEDSKVEIDEPTLLKKTILFTSQKAEPIYAYDFSVKARGTFASMLYFFQALEHGSHIGFIQSIRIKSSGRDFAETKEAPTCEVLVSVIGQDK